MRELQVTCSPTPSHPSPSKLREIPALEMGAKAGDRSDSRKICQDRIRLGTV